MDVGNQDSSVGIVTGFGFHDRGWIPGGGGNILSTPRR
jgi:hypothetical protein